MASPGYVRTLMLLGVSLLLCYAQPAWAQETEVAWDTTIVTPAEPMYDTAAYAENDYDDYSGGDTEELPDSFITVFNAPNAFTISTDSFNVARSSNGFGYMAWVDSLLNARNAQIKPKEKEAPANNTVVEPSFGFRTLMWLTICLLVLWGIYKLTLSKNSIFGKNTTFQETAGATEDEAQITNLEQAAASAAQAGNHRLATRYLFLHSLQLLARSHLLTLAPQKTNYQYLLELRGSRVHSGFAALALDYEYAWYGLRPVTPAHYSEMDARYKQFWKSI